MAEGLSILIANIWNRNLKYWWEFIEKKDKWFFEFTEMLWDNFEEEKENLSVNIINTILSEYNINKIYLIVTNQWFHQDTYFEWLIIKKLLWDKYDVKLIEKKDDPRNRENAFLFIENFFDENISWNDNIIISWSGWIPAMKEALNFYAVMKNQSPIILDVDESTEKVFSSMVQNEYLKNMDKEKIRWMIENFNYAWALYILNWSRINNSDFRKCLEYAKNRFDFLFEKTCECKISSLYELPNENSLENQIKELLQNIEISYLKADYAVMVAKLYSLIEWILHYIFESITNKSFSDIDYCKSIWLISNSYWDDENEKIPPFEYEKYVANYRKVNRLSENLFNIWLKYIDLKKMKEIRNSSFIAHGFKWVSSEDAKNMYKIINWLKIDFWIKWNIFKVFNEKLLKLL